MSMKWKVGGVNLFRRNFQVINDEVEAPDIKRAMKRARSKYPKAPELSVRGLKDETKK